MINGNLPKTGTLSKKQLAEMYGVSRETLRKMLISVNLRGTAKILFPHQLNLIYLKYGKPF
ncbi:MAG: hypothetical protein IT212_07095 [Bacteroidia bacterium]|nr:hypothetical protein [Bacteroidia bacterium]